jgi:hypothetical protein
MGKGMEPIEKSLVMVMPVSEGLMRMEVVVELLLKT